MEKWRGKCRGKSASFSVVLPLFLLLVLFPSAESRAGVDCFQCHPDLKTKCASGYVHRVVRQENCAGCHNPHTARFNHLLIDEGAGLCYRCHREQKEKWQGLKVHGPLREEGRGCLGCHEAHVSPYRSQLKAKGQNLCFQCHSKEKYTASTVHEPVKEGKCQTCHVSHASKEDFLLIEPLRTLCLGCHGQKNLTEFHQGFDVRGSDCTLCHSPHASNRKGLIYDFTHTPYEEQKCKSCHQNEKKSTLVAHGAKLCYTCHQKEKEKFQRASRTHMASGDTQCTYCHNPHASERKNLTRKDVRALCESCHPRIAARLKQNAGDYRHPEVVKGNCTSCHDPHSSSLPNFYKTDILTLCTKCHARQKNACHPVGEKAIDPRDRKSPITCQTCHDPMGTKFMHALRWDGSQALCEQCHKKK
ncbi:MAG: cytochrome c3 family protein [bacterium]